jgi:hypothetical protein
LLFLSVVDDESGARCTIGVERSAAQSIIANAAASSSSRQLDWSQHCSSIEQQRQWQQQQQQ